MTEVWAAHGRRCALPLRERPLVVRGRGGTPALEPLEPLRPPVGEAWPEAHFSSLTADWEFPAQALCHRGSSRGNPV